MSYRWLKLILLNFAFPQAVQLLGVKYLVGIAWAGQNVQSCNFFYYSVAEFGRLTQKFALLHEMVMTTGEKAFYQCFYLMVVCATISNLDGGVCNHTKSPLLWGFPCTFLSYSCLWHWWCLKVCSLTCTNASEIIFCKDFTYSLVRLVVIPGVCVLYITSMGSLAWHLNIR